MKKFIPVLFVILSILAFGGCGGGGGEPTTSLNGIWKMDSGVGEIVTGSTYSALAFVEGNMTIVVITDDYDNPTCNISSYTKWQGSGGTMTFRTPSSSTSVVRTGKDSFTFPTENGQIDFNTNGDFKAAGNVTENNVNYGYILEYKGHKM